MGDTELATHCEKLELFDIISEKFELDGAVKEIHIAGGNSHIELDNKLSNGDICSGLYGAN